MVFGTLSCIVHGVSFDLPPTKNSCPFCPHHDDATNHPRHGSRRRRPCEVVPGDRDATTAAATESSTAWAARILQQQERRRQISSRFRLVGAADLSDEPLGLNDSLETLFSFEEPLRLSSRRLCQWRSSHVVRCIVVVFSGGDRNPDRSSTGQQQQPSSRRQV